MNKIKAISPVIVSLHLFLFACYNPVEPSFSLRITFNVGSSNEIKLHIFSSTGEKVNTLVDGPFIRGAYSVQWNGLNFEGQPVVEGVYYYQIEYWSGDMLTDLVVEGFIVR